MPLCCYWATTKLLLPKNFGSRQCPAGENSSPPRPARISEPRPDIPRGQNNPRPAPIRVGSPRGSALVEKIGWILYIFRKFFSYPPFSV